MKKISSLILIFSICITCFFATGCSFFDRLGAYLRGDSVADVNIVATKSAVSIERKEIDFDSARGVAMKYVEELDFDEKIGQLFSVNLELLDSKKGSYYEHTKFNKRMKQTLEKYHVGGVILFSRNLRNRRQTTRLINKLQKNSEIPLFVMVDEEGGRVARIGSNPDMHTTTFQTPFVIGEKQSPDYCKRMGSIIATDLKELGFNVNLAPVADVNTSELNLEIGDRSFGSDPEKVSQYVTNFVEGTQGENVSSTLKHFPGQGSSTGDTHVTSVDIDSDIANLRKVDFVPFEAGIEAGADFVMVSHISVSKVTETNTPASMSDLIMRVILREELKFEGICITDAFDMSSITDYYSTGEACVKAIKAGADIILMPHDLKEAYSAVYDAVKSGEIDEAMIDETIIRILTKKFQRGIIATVDAEDEDE